MKTILVYRALNAWYSLVNLDDSDKVDEIKLRHSIEPKVADWQALTNSILVKRAEISQLPVEVK